MSNPRTRSPFGSFQMRRTHLVTAPDPPEPPMPPVSDLAARLRDGESIESVADSVDRAVGTIRGKLNLAGYSVTGYPRRKK